MKWSIRTRLTAWYSAVVVVVLVAAVVAVTVVQSRLGLERLDGELARLLLTLEGVMRTEFGEGLDLQAAADEASIEVVAPDRALFLAAPDGRVIAAWGLRLPSPWLPPLEARTSVRHEVEFPDGNWRAVGRVVDVGAHRYVASILAPLDALDRERRELLTALAIGVLVALIVAAVGGAIIGRQTLRPLEAMASQAASITERDPSRRLTTPNTHDELGRLAASFNALLDRLASALRMQRQFMADASHELRTPVSVVRTAAQVTLVRDERSAEEYRDALSVVAEHSVRLTHLVDSMFMLSRAEAHGLPLARVSVYLNDIVSDCVRGMRVLANERGIRIDVGQEPELPMAGDDALLRQLFGNLLDNAVRHAATAVTVSLERHDGHGVVNVTNDGPLIPPADRERIFERFVRLEPGPGGAGLGLPIARTIAEAHGGRLTLDARTNGVCFSVFLPLEPDR